MTPPYISAGDVMKMVISAPESRLRQAGKRDGAAKGSAAAELRDILHGPDEECLPGPDWTPQQLAALTAEERADCMAERTRAEQLACAHARGEWTLVTGSAFTCPVVPVGASMKAGKRRGSTRYTQEQLEFLDWAYARGVDHKGMKMTAREAAAAMTLMGTETGRQQFGCEAATGCQCPSVRRDKETRDQCMWHPTADGQCKFRAPELLEHWSFRTWFSGQKAAFQKKLEKSVKDNQGTTVDQVIATAIDDAEDTVDDES